MYAQSDLSLCLVAHPTLFYLFYPNVLYPPNDTFVTTDGNVQCMNTAKIVSSVAIDDVKDVVKYGTCSVFT